MGQYPHYTIVTMANEMKKNVVGTFIFTIKGLTSKTNILNKKPDCVPTAIDLFKGT